MKTLTTLLATSLFAVTAYAGDVDVYGGFAGGNPDLAAWQLPVSGEMTGVQPGIGDATRWSNGSESALFKSAPHAAATSGRVDIYGAFQSQDLGPRGY
ncbi:MAG: hypothetical protein WAM94_14310 [Chromatiaceae bacterium]